MKKLLLAAGLMGAVLNMNAQDCAAVADLNEDFSGFTTGQTATFPQFCWTSIANGPMVYPNSASDNSFAQFYSLFSPNTAGYLISPAVNSFDGNHTLTFDASATAAITLQPGYLTNAADATTFVAVGDVITLTTTSASYTIEYPEVAGVANIAFQFTAPGVHQGASVDNVVWAAPAVECPAVSELTESFSDFVTGQTATFPQFCWTSIANGPMVYPNSDSDNSFAQFYSLFSPNTAAYLVTPAINNFDGNHTLTFDASATAAITLQPGYVTDAADASTFVAVGDVITLTTTSANYTIEYPEVAGVANIAFQFTAPGVHQGASVDNVIWAETPEECPAVSELSEGFSDFVTGQTATFPQFCWTSIANGPMVYPNSDSDNSFAQFYSLFSPNTAAYLVTPAINNFDGNHTLTFDASATAAITLQPGYLTDAADASTFVAVGDVITLTTTSATYSIAYPEVVGVANIAFQFTAPGVHQGASIDNVVWAETPADCPVLSALNETFESFTGEDFPQNCWTAIAEGPMVYPSASNGNTTAVFYSYFSADTAAYLISPELNSFDGNHTLTFDAASATGVTVQPGYLTNPADASTFVAVGDLITLAASPATTYNITFPSVTGNAYIAFQITAGGVHQAATVDNVVWQVTAGTDNLQKKAFSLYPNPAVNGIVNIANTSGNEGTVNVYSLTGANVFQAKAATGNQQLNLSQLGAGMYIVQFTTGNYTTSQKLIIQ